MSSSSIRTVSFTATHTFLKKRWVHSFLNSHWLNELIHSTLFWRKQFFFFFKSLKSTSPTHGDLLATGHPWSPVTNPGAHQHGITLPYVGKVCSLRAADLTPVRCGLPLILLSLDGYTGHTVMLQWSSLAHFLQWPVPWTCAPKFYPSHRQHPEEAECCLAQVTGWTLLTSAWLCLEGKEWLAFLFITYPYYRLAAP